METRIVGIILFLSGVMLIAIQRLLFKDVGHCHPSLVLGPRFGPVCGAVRIYLQANATRYLQFNSAALNERVANTRWRKSAVR